MIPLRLIISVAIIGLISFLAFSGMNQQYQTFSEIEFKKTITLLGNNIESMVITGQPRDINDISSPRGTTQHHKITLPNEINSLTFGILSPKYTTKSKDISMNGLMYSSTNTGTHISWCDQNCRFIQGVYNRTTQHWTPLWHDPQFVIDIPGEYRLSFELITDGSTLYVLVYDLLDKPG